MANVSGSSTQPDSFASATDMLSALRSGAISSSELTELHITRIEELDSEIHAIAVPTFDRARDAAARADAPRSAEAGGALLGLPVTLKESTQVGGLPQSAGIAALEGYRPAGDGRLAHAILGAGACLLGKTNIPVALGDWQADSPNYPRTNNPWNLDRTPGGSTGGGAAALAAGLTPLELGSDIGGSIRVPAAYCGVYGHRPSETAIPRSGAFPFADDPTPVALMGVQGPLARSATDLELLFDLVTGADVGEDRAWRITVPPARHQRLSDFRVAVMPPMPWVEPSHAVHGAVDALIEVLRAERVTLGVAMPDVDMDRYFTDYLALLSVMTAGAMSRVEREAAASTLRAIEDRWSAAQADGMVMDATDFVALVRRREAARRAWRAFFDDWDVLVGPITLDVAFPHQTGPQRHRTLDIDGRTVPYLLNIVHPMWAIFAGQPSTAFPAGTSGGLPVGLQAIGPYLEDRTPLRFAQLLERAWHSFTPPPGYSSSIFSHH